MNVDLKKEFYFNFKFKDNNDIIFYSNVFDVKYLEPLIRELDGTKALRLLQTYIGKNLSVQVEIKTKKKIDDIFTKYYNVLSLSEIKIN